MDEANHRCGRGRGLRGVALYLIESLFPNPGLNGCVRRFKLGHREIKIQATSEPFSLRRVALSECRLSENELSPNDVSPIELPSVEVSPCRKNPCLNRGLCKEISRTAFACECKQGFEGERCQDAVVKTKPGSSVLDCSSLDLGDSWML